MKLAAIGMLIIAGAVVTAAPAQAGRDEPIQNRSDIPISWQAQGQPSLERIQRAIIAGCALRGWQCQAIKPGEVRAVLHVRQHMAEALIAFDTQTFSVNYVTSTELRYDAEKNTIHRKYNLWVSNLIADISGAIALIQ